MQTRIAFCPACDRDVHIVITDGPSHDGQANLHDADAVCIDIGERCTGAVCPIVGTSPVVMVARLVRDDLLSALHPRVSLMCERCNQVTTHVLIERRYATCTDCGATSERTFVPDS